MNQLQERTIARTRAVLRRKPNINFDQRRIAAAKEIAKRKGRNINDIKIKFLLPQGSKDIEVKKAEML